MMRWGQLWGELGEELVQRTLRQGALCEPGGCGTAAEGLRCCRAVRSPGPEQGSLVLGAVSSA